MADALPKSLHYLPGDTLDDAYAKGTIVAKWDGADHVTRPVPFLYSARQRRAWLKGYADQRATMKAATSLQR